MNLEGLVEKRALIRRELQELQDSSTLPAADGAWTPRQVLHHLLQAENNALVLLERLVVKAGTLPAKALVGPLPIRDGLLDFDLDLAMSVPAARGTEPDPAVDEAALRTLENSVEARFEALLDLGRDHDLRGLCFPHPLAGRLNYYEWLVFGIVHEELHIRVLRGKPGKP